MEEKILRWIWEKLLVGVKRKTKRGLKGPKEGERLAKVN
jgi:hypothetical protein